VPPLPKQFTRRKFLTALGLAGLGGAGYVRWLEPEWLDVGRHEVSLSKTLRRAPLKILHLADLHASPDVSLDFLATAVRLGLAQQPDVICVTGDFISRKFDRFDDYARVLAPLAQAAPTFASLGNHDGGRWAARYGGGYADTQPVRKMLRAAGIRLLPNEAAEIKVQDWRLRLVGVGDMWSGEFNPASAFPKNSPAADATVLLTHNPDSKTSLKLFPWDLALCGHTHGGQVRLPFIGPLFVPVADKNFIAGLYRWDNRWLHITRGVGSAHGVRFNCRPEVSVLTLT
jgi:predicted MPP superfamily phosphohydrolase